MDAIFYSQEATEFFKIKQTPFYLTGFLAIQRKPKVAQSKEMRKVIRRRKTGENKTQQNKDTQRELAVYPIFSLT